MKLIRSVLFLFSLLAFNTALQAQLFTKPNPAFNDALQKMISDIPYHLQNLQGSLLQKNEQSSVFESRIKIPGAVSTTVTSYNSKTDKSKSIEAVIVETESFDEAKKKYSELVNQLKAVSLQLPGDQKVFKWKVDYEKPQESKNFTSSIFTTGSAREEYKNLKAEVSIVARITSYTVSFFMYAKKEDTERVTQDTHSY